MLIDSLQALGQCARYIQTKLPCARLVKTPSTAAAAKEVLDDSSGASAAICSKLCAELDPRLNIAEEGIQDAASA